MHPGWVSPDSAPSPTDPNSDCNPPGVAGRGGPTYTRAAPTQAPSKVAASGPLPPPPAGVLTPCAQRLLFREGFLDMTVPSPKARGTDCHPHPTHPGTTTGPGLAHLPRTRISALTNGRGKDTGPTMDALRTARTWLPAAVSCHRLPVVFMTLQSCLLHQM